MGTNVANLVADLFLFCYERDFMMSLPDDKQAGIIDAFNTYSQYRWYWSFVLDLHLSMSNDIVSTKFTINVTI